MKLIFISFCIVNQKLNMFLSKIIVKGVFCSWTKYIFILFTSDQSHINVIFLVKLFASNVKHSTQHLLRRYLILI